MNTQTQLTEEQRKTLLERVAKTQDGVLKGDDHLSNYILEQVAEAADASSAECAFRYAIDELKRAAEAARKYDLELEAGE